MISFAQQAHDYLLANKLEAPSFSGLSCPAQLITTGSTATFTMDTYAKANEVWGYVAIVTAPDASQSAYILPGGDIADLSLDTPVYGEYTVSLRTL